MTKRRYRYRDLLAARQQKADAKTKSATITSQKNASPAINKTTQDNTSDSCDPENPSLTA
jgi:hypothetical protein